MQSDSYCKMKTGNPYSKIALIVCYGIILVYAFSFSKWNAKESQATLSWDVFGYYLYLPAVFIYDDLEELKFKDEIITKYNPTGDFYQAYDHCNGSKIIKYPIGLALLYLPFFLLGHFFAWVFGFDMDGFSLPYQMAISFGSIAWAMVGLWVMRKNLLGFVSDKAAAIGIVIVALCTNFLFYSAQDGAMPHIWLFTLYALMFYFSLRFFEKPGLKLAIAMGAITGLAALTRPTEIIILLIPVIWGLFKLKKDLLPFLIRNFKIIIAGGLITVLIGSIQIIYWKLIGGEFLIYSYGDQSFSWFEKHHFMDVIFSYRKGWLIYTPVMVLAVPGLIFLYRKSITLFACIIIYAVLNIYIVSAWDIWWYGGGYGQRALIPSYALLAFPIACLAEYSIKRMAIIIGLGLFIVTTLFISFKQSYQLKAKNGGFETEVMSKAYFWRIFWKTQVPESDFKLLDTDEDYRGTAKDLTLIFESGFEDSLALGFISENPINGTGGISLNAGIQYSSELPIPLSYTYKWLRVNVQALTNNKEWNYWYMTQMQINFYSGDNKIKSNMIRLQRYMHDNHSTDIFMDVKIPVGPIDKCTLTFWNANGQKPIFLDNVKVKLFNE